LKKNNHLKFTIYTPFGTKKTLYYNSNHDFYNKIGLLESFIFRCKIHDIDEKLDESLNRNTYYKDQRNKFCENLQYKKSNLYDYCLTRWLWPSKFDDYRFNYEDRVKSFLNRCGDFILKKYIINGMVLTDGRKSEIIKHEIPVSCYPPEYQEMIFGIDQEDNNEENLQGNTLILTNEVLLGNIDIDNYIRFFEKVKKRYKQSKQYKMKKIYITPDKEIKELYKLKNGDLQERPLIKELSEEDLIKWQQKPFKNIHGENIYEYRTKIIKGNNGVVNPKQPYKWAWCYVNTENEFEFDSKKYKIDNTVKQYQGRIIRDRHGEEDIIYDMDMILCYEQNGKQFYFDQNIDRIKNEHIQQI
jgi:hypothetical protein